MLKQVLTQLLSRELDKLEQKLLAYPNEADMWVRTDKVDNPGGNLALHLLGNVDHFIGHALGNTGYVRNRDWEFTDTNVPREKLIEALHETKAMINRVLPQLTEEQLQANYPFPKVNTEQYTTAMFLTHTVSHFSYHLGQIDYHRRLLANK